jgi:hypothetical protein
LSILSIKNTKIFYRWIDNIDENETKSIDRYRYRSIDPSLIVPIYGCQKCPDFDISLLGSGWVDSVSPGGSVHFLGLAGHS